MKLISLGEYADMHGKARTTVREMAQRGSLTTAKKIGRDWLVDADEPYPDRRVKSGKYIGARNKSE